MKHLLILVILAVFLTLALVGTEVASQGLSPLPPCPIARDLGPEYIACMEETLAAYPNLGCHTIDAECRARTPPARPEPLISPVKSVSGPDWASGTWWKSPTVECVLFTDGYRIVRIQCEIE